MLTIIKHDKIVAPIKLLLKTTCNDQSIHYLGEK